MKQNDNFTTSSFSTKSFKNVSKTDIDLPISTINSNINIPNQFRISTSTELTHVPSYQKRDIEPTLHGIFKPRRNFDEFLNKIWIAVTAIYSLS